MMHSTTIQGFRLSPHQQHLWPLCAADGGEAYLACCAVAVEGGLDIALLRAALEDLVQRHEILRTAFQHLPGMSVPLQVVLEQGRVELRSLTAAVAGSEDAVEAVLQATGDGGFDLCKGPLLKVVFLEVSPGRHLLGLGLPALCADHQGLENVVRELARSCAGRLGGSAEPEGSIQYADVSQVLNEILEAEDMEQGRLYWQKREIAPVADLSLQTPSKAAEEGRFTPETVSRRLDRTVLAGTELLEISAPALLCAGWSALLARLAGQSEGGVGVAFDGRTYDGLDEALGVFVRYLPVGGPLSPDLPFADFARQLCKEMEEAGAWQDSFAWKGGAFPRAVFEMAPQLGRYETGASTFSVLRRMAHSDRFEVKLTCTEADGSWRLDFHYDASLFPREEIDLLADRFESLLRSAGSAPQTALGDLNILSPAERLQLLVQLESTRHEEGAGDCLHRLVAAQARRSPNQIAVLSAGRELTYSQLEERASRLAGFLRRIGVGPEARVALGVVRSPEMVIGILGILKAGGAYVPLDPAYPAERLAWLLKDSGAELLLTQEHLLGSFADAPRQIVCLDRDWSVIAAEHEGEAPDTTTPENAAYVIYTSGSTGRPKGVVVSHRAILNRLLWMQRTFPLLPDDRVLQRTPYSFDASIWEIFVPLLAGARLVLASPEGHKDSAYLVATVSQEGVTTLQLVPSQLAVFLSEREVTVGCRSLRRLFCGGEALSGELRRQVFERLPAAVLCNLYGPTETAIDATYHVCSRGEAGDTVPIGRPLDNLRVALVDRRLQLVPAGRSGELLVGGRSLARGYLDRPDLTAERFIPDPFGKMPGERLYRTGDLARALPAGEIEFLGRIDHQVKIRGFRIELGEIEAALERHPQVRQAVVLAREDAPGEKRLVAYVVEQTPSAPAPAESLSPDLLRAFLQRHLPEHMVPSAFVFLERLPLTPNGKLDHRALPEPGTVRPGLRQAYASPRNPAEELLARIWAEVLRLDEVGVHDNFFALGGDSILAIQIVSRANEAGLRLATRQIFERQTVAELAMVAGLAPDTAPEAEEESGPIPLTPAQQAFFEQEPIDLHHFNQSVLLEVSERLDLLALDKAVGALLAAHETLRSRFVHSDTGWRQEIAPQVAASPFSCVDLTMVSNGLENSAIETAAAMVQESLDLSRGLLLRVVGFDLGEGRPGRLLLVLHHLIIDGVSWRVLIADLEGAYASVRREESPRLSARGTSFQRWARLLEEHAQSERLRDELSYWLAESRERVPDLPVDKIRGHNTVASARQVRRELAPEETARLLKDVPQAYRTQINDVLLAGLARALCGWTGAPAVLVDLEGHGREEIMEGVDLARTVGWFTTLFPVLLEPGDVGPGDAIQAIKEQLRAVPQRGIGYGLLRFMNSASEVREALRSLPQAQISFNYLGQFDQVLAGDSVFGPARESKGPVESPRRLRPHFLEVTSHVAGGRFGVSWTYSENVHRRQTVERLAEIYMAELRSLIAHCLSSDAGGVTPSDFPLARLSQKQLEKVLAQAGKAGA
jgi:amino acid adenylation domain-containing protein/non-ribosomal peptide synthase protein (TIGR01720 family)